MTRKVVSVLSLVLLALAGLPAVGGEGEPPAGAGASGNAAWVALWQDAYREMADPKFDPERVSAAVAVDRASGAAYLSMWHYGVWMSSDGGKSFARADGGKVSGRNCGPIQGNSLYVVPDGGRLVTFNMNNSPGPSGCSYDGGKTWESFEAVGRNWDFGAMDFGSKAVFAARHEDDGLHLSSDGGKTWTRLAKPRGGVTGLAALGKTLLLASAKSIERSEDDGKTWAKIADFGAVGPAVTFKDKVWWLSTEGQRSVLVSADGGKTWAVHGEPAPGPVDLGPFFGRGEDHIVVAGRAGFYESTDGAKTWKLAVPAPENMIGGRGLYGAAFDPVHDVFYMTIWGKPVMKYARGAKPDYSVPAAAGGDESPKIELVDKPWPKVRCVVPSGADIGGGFFYLGGEDGILCFKRNLESGKLDFVEQVPEPRCGGYAIRCAGGRIYGVTPHDGYRRMTWNGLAWFEVDAATGKPERKGVVECPASRQMLLGPGGKDLYLKAWGGAQDKVFWYRLGDDGKPAKAGEAAGKGIGASVRRDYPGILVMAPDGRHLYAVSAEDYAIARIERKPDGAIAWQGAVDLEAVVKRDAGNANYLWTSLGISPDGKYVYASVRNGKPTGNFYGVFRRDAETGALKFQEKFSGEQNPLANLKGWNMVFAADGRGGYLGSFAGPLMTFRYDEATGHLTDPAAIKETLYNGSSHLVLDAAAGLLYVGGREYGHDRLFVFRTGRK